jgi:hypothetical protein
MSNSCSYFKKARSRHPRQMSDNLRKQRALKQFLLTVGVNPRYRNAGIVQTILGLLSPETAQKLSGISRKDVPNISSKARRCFEEHDYRALVDLFAQINKATSPRSAEKQLAGA